MSVAKKAGRKAGSRNRGLHFKAGRGWHGLIDGKYLLLRDVCGEKYVSRNLSLSVLEEARQRLLAAQASARIAVDASETVTVADVCRAYLEHCKAKNRPNTYDLRSRLLFDLAYGLPSRFLSAPSTATSKDKIHKGYGALLACDLTHRDVTEWCEAHKGWTTHRMPKQAIKRAFSWACSEEVALLKVNPLAKLKIPVAKKRVTYFTPEQEEAICGNCKPNIARIIKALIRTGCRPGELRLVTAQHVETTSKGMILRLKAAEHKTGSHKGRERVVRIAEELKPTVQQLMKRHPSGPLFRNTHGGAWTETALRGVFYRLKMRLKKQGVKLDDDSCIYTCRHTFAKRVLGGYWTGKPATIEQLCALMGNSREVAWEHYGQWCESYDDPLWQAVG